MKKYSILFFFLFVSSFLYSDGKNKYVEEYFEVNDQLLTYHFYKTQEEFDLDFYKFIVENTFYTTENMVRDDYMTYGTFSYNDKLLPELQDFMIKNNYLYSVTFYTDDYDGERVTYVIVNKKYKDKFYFVGWYRKNSSFQSLK